MLPAWVGEYVGLPFRSHGRTREGVDCYGLVRLVLSERYGKHLPPLDTAYLEAGDRDEVAELLRSLRPLLAGEPIAVPEPGDVAVILVRGTPCHLGLYVGDGYVLEARYGRDSVLERVSDARISRRIEGYYRVR